MKRLGIIVGMIGLLALLFLKSCVGPTYSFRYRLAVEVDTPEGVKSGSSVIEVTVRDDSVIIAPVTAQKVHSRMKGEAVFIDLGQSKHVIALLAAGPTGQGELTYIVQQTFGVLKVEDYGR